MNVYYNIDHKVVSVALLLLLVSVCGLFR